MQGNFKHGMRRSTEYSIWQNMLNRCRNPKVKCFRNYGARGIKVAPEFATFQSFFSVMGKRPKGKTLERIDVNGDYSAANCRWATPKEQARNMRVNRMITFNGETKCLAAWAECTGLDAETIRERIDTRGWSIKHALTQPPVPPKERSRWRFVD